MGRLISISAYDQMQSMGQDATNLALIKALQEACPDAELVILSNDPGLASSYLEVRAVNRWQPADLINCLARSDLFVSGGGGLLEEFSSRHGLLTHLGALHLAQRLRVPTMVYGQGVGPIRLASNKALTAKILERTQVLTVRDPASKSFLESIGVKRPIISTADPALGLFSEAPEKDAGEKVLRGYGWRGNGPTILVALRPWKDEDQVHVYARAFDQLVRAGYELVFIAMDVNQDRLLSQAVGGHMEEESIFLDGRLDTRLLGQIFACADGVLGMRLHALIFGALARKPLLAISCDPKIDSFMAQVGQSRVIPIAQVTTARLAQELFTLAEEEGPDDGRMAYLSRLAKLPAKMARTLLY